MTRINPSPATPKVTILGAGGYVFPLRLIGDMLAIPELHGATLCLMDVDEPRLERTATAVAELAAYHAIPITIEATTDRRRALDGAAYVIVTFQVGGLDAYRLDVEIPRRYGIDQSVGDTLGPGGVFRFLRSAPVYAAIAADMVELRPGALLLNYANPMAMACWYLDLLGVRTVGLCHSVQGTSRMLARRLSAPYDELEFLVAGINHQAWLLSLRWGDRDLYPALRTIAADSLGPVALKRPAADTGDHSGADRDATDYEGAAERVRDALFTTFGYYQTESSHHASEYAPYFRKSAELVDAYIPHRWDYYHICRAHDGICRAHDGDAQAADLLRRLKADLTPSIEYGARILRAMETGEPVTVYGNVANRGLIPNLPDGCCVEVPCLVDRNGVQPTAPGPLPPQCAALNRTNVNVQELAVAAAVTGDPEHVHHALALDPLTGALLTLPRIRELTDELLAAESAWLPSFGPARVDDV